MFRPRLVQGPSESLWAIGLFLSLSPNGDFELQALISSHMGSRIVQTGQTPTNNKANKCSQ